MRAYLFILGMFAVVLAFSAAPASAHSSGHGDAANIEADGADGHDPDGNRRQADHGGGHNPTDHSHPIGEDDYHSKASHSSLDFAHDHIAGPALTGLVRAFCLPRLDRPLNGIAVSPPVRPPLA